MCPLRHFDVIPRHTLLTCLTRHSATGHSLISFTGVQRVFDIDKCFLFRRFTDLGVSEDNAAMAVVCSVLYFLILFLKSWVYRTLCRVPISIATWRHLANARNMIFPRSYWCSSIFCYIHFICYLSSSSPSSSSCLR